MAGVTAPPVLLASAVIEMSRLASVPVHVSPVTAVTLMVPAVLTVQSPASKVQAVTFSSMTHRMVSTCPSLLLSKKVELFTVSTAKAIGILKICNVVGKTNIAAIMK